MTTTQLLANMPSTTATDVAVYFLDQSLFKLRKTEIDKARNTIVAEYVYASGDADMETTLLVTHQLDVVKNVQRITWSLKTVQTVDVDGVITESEPAIVSITVTSPGRFVGVGQYSRMLGSAFALTFNGVTTKVPNLGILESLNRGLAAELYG